MKQKVILLWTVVMIFSLSACQDNDAGQIAEEMESAEPAGEPDRSTRPLEQAAKERLAGEPLLENGVAERFKAMIEGGEEVAGKTARFEYLEFEPGVTVVDAGNPNRREIEELAMVLNAYPRMNVEIIVYADHNGARKSPEALAGMRGMFIKSSLMDNGVEGQMINLKTVVSAQGGDGTNKENNRVVAHLMGE